MNHQSQKILTRCHELQVANSKSEPQEWQTWLLRDWQEVEDHGPTYKASKWFGSMPERDRVGMRRCIQKLEKAGLLTIWRRWGTQMTNVKLTEAGEEIARNMP